MKIGFITTYPPNVKEIRILKGKLNGFGYIEMETEIEASKAIVKVVLKTG